MNQKTNTKWAHRLVTVFTIFTMLFCLTGCGKKTPREALEEAYQKTFTETNPTENILGLSELTAKLKESKAHSTGYSFTIQEISSDELGPYGAFLSGLGISVDSVSDLLNRKAKATADITYGGSGVLSLTGQVQGAEIFLTSPQFLDNYLSINLSTLKEDLNSDSLVAQLMRAYGVILPEDPSADLLNTFSSLTSLTTLGKFTSACKDLDNAILVKELDKKTITLPAGVSAKTAYTVTIPKYAYVEVFNTALDLSSEYSSILSGNTSSDDNEPEDFSLTDIRLAFQEIADAIGDLVLTVSVTKNGTINYVASTIAQEDNTISFTATFDGEKSPLEKVAVVVDVVAQGTTLSIAYDQTFDTESNEITMSMNATADGTAVCTFDCAGQYSDIEKGKKYALDFDYIEFEMADLFSISLSGDYYVDTTKCDITAPTEAKYSLFRMNEDEFNELYEEFALNLQENPLLMTILGSLDFGM